MDIELGDLILQNSVYLIGEPTTALFKKEDINLENTNIFSLGRVDYHCFADVSLWLRLLAKGNCYYINENLTSYRAHKGQALRKPHVAIKCITERFNTLKPSRLMTFLADKN